jgi:GTP-binding protein
MIGEERVIVSDIPGTTRDAIDTYVENERINMYL